MIALLDRLIFTVLGLCPMERLIAIARTRLQGRICMQNGQPSRTALGAAIQRAAHQTLDDAKVFKDAFARLLLGQEADALIEAVSADPAQRQMRIFMAARSRFAEDCQDAAVSRGVRQVAIVGAGLDTFSLRNPHVTLGWRVFEVDHPTTQAWTRERIAEPGLAAPASLTFAHVDFDRQSLAEGLVAAGFQPTQPAFFHWLGVVPYLRRDAISAILQFIASVRGRRSCSITPNPSKIIPPSAARTWLP